MESTPANPSNQDRRVERVLQALKQEYVVVGKTRVSAWHAWLLIGIAAGIAAGVILVANRSGEVEEGRAATGDAIAITVELDLPSYYPDFLRHPQKFFSGQPLKIMAPAFPDQASVALADTATGKQQSVSAKQSKERPNRAKITGQTSFSFTPPADLPTGQYRISFVAGGQTYQLPLAINGLTAAEKDISGAITISDILQRIAIRFRSQICMNCFWEMVFTGQPGDPSKLFHSYAGPDLTRSSDGGHSWDAANINTITTYPDPSITYAGDSKLFSLSNGNFFLSAMYYGQNGSVAGFGGGLYNGRSSGGLAFTTFQTIPSTAPPNSWLFVDYPKIVIDHSNSSVYISGNAAWFEAIQNFGIGLYVSQDYGQTFTQYQLPYGYAVSSMAVDASSTLYAVLPGGQLYRFHSFKPFRFDTLPIPGMAVTAPARISTRSNRAWFVYPGPEIVADTSSSSPHFGRLYVVWAQEEKAVADPNFEYPYYGYNFDVFVSYSDDKGQTWSPKVKVNDDRGAGDQFFPSMRLDANGVLSVAFVDHRNNQNLPVFDIYYAKSSDGVKFSRNLRVNTAPIANNPSGGRTIGDYLDMVAAYSDRVYIAYPCGQSEYSPGPAGACMAQVDPRLVR